MIIIIIVCSLAFYSTLVQICVYNEHCTYYASCLLFPLILHSFHLYLRVCVYGIQFLLFLSVLELYEIYSYSRVNILQVGIIGLYEVFIHICCSSVFRLQFVKLIFDNFAIFSNIIKYRPIICVFLSLIGVLY